MAKRDKEELKKGKNRGEKNIKEAPKDQLLTSWTKRWIKAILMFLVAIVVGLAFFDKAGSAGEVFVWTSKFLVGQAIYTVPFFLFLGGLIFLKTRKKGKNLAMLLAIVICVVGISGILAAQNLEQMNGGWTGFLLAKVSVNFFGLLVANIIFGAVILIGAFIFLQFVWAEITREKVEEEKKQPSFTVNKQEGENFKIKNAIEETKQEKPKQQVKSKLSLFAKKTEEPVAVKISTDTEKKSKEAFALPPLDLLNKNESAPTSGNIKENSVTIKNTFENFGIPVEMSEVNVGPTVTQYAFKPAEGVKLSKITTLSNNLALALAAHPIRIEAPIPGKSLVGIEVPNKVRSIVTLRNLVAHPNYQNSPAHVLIAMGRNVSGSPIYTDLTEMPHMLVAGSTGTGKTIFLNSLILSLLYKSTPENLRLIMVDPKRVEFQNYNEIPHLLCPVIYDATKTMNALQWLIKEMERRFEVFSEVSSRNILSYNSNKSIIASGLQLPYIVLVVDELADLMAAKGKELEAGIVRLAQMARATGIHLVLATQRPSVEVITGLIKANVPSRVTFQVASQVDSRTVLDTAGAEKLIGAGDMLFLSSKSTKITRIQGAYVSEKEVKRVADYVAEQGKKVGEQQTVLSQSLKDSLEQADAAKEAGAGGEFFGDDDPLFEDVKRIVLETKKASASFLQRRLRIGYSRAARLIDMLEDKGIVGPADGAKPREVYGDRPEAQFATTGPQESGFDESEDTPKASGDDEGGWQKV